MMKVGRSNPWAAPAGSPRQAMKAVQGSMSRAERPRKAKAQSSEASQGLGASCSASRRNLTNRPDFRMSQKTMIARAPPAAPCHWARSVWARAVACRAWGTCAR